MIEVRLADEKDKNQLINYLQHYKSEKLLRQRIECYLTHNKTVIALDNGKLIGLIQFYLKENPQTGMFELEEFHVLEEYRNKGIGTKLLEECMKQVRIYCSENGIKLKTIYCLQDKENTPVLKVFEKFGFQLKGEAPQLFKNETTVITVYKETQE